MKRTLFMSIATALVAMVMSQQASAAYGYNSYGNTSYTPRSITGSSYNNTYSSTSSYNNKYSSTSSYNKYTPSTDNEKYDSGYNKYEDGFTKDICFTSDQKDPNQYQKYPNCPVSPS